MQPPRLPAIGTCYEIDLEDGRSMVGQVAVVRPVGRTFFLAVFEGFQAMGAPVDLDAWSARPVTHGFELERVDLECGAVTLFDLGHRPVDRHRVPLPHLSRQLDSGEWEVRSWDDGRRWSVSEVDAGPFPLAGGGSAARALRETLQECATVSEDEDDCRYRVGAFFGESIPPEGAGAPSGAPAFDAAGASDGWRTLVVQLSLNKSPTESLAALTRLEEIRQALDEIMTESKFGVTGGIDHRPETPQGWIYLHTHDSAPLRPLVRESLDESRFANRYAIEEYGGLI
jgi:hypothetical protein